MSSNARPTTGGEITMGAYITKETFCKALSLIQEQDSINDAFAEALQTVGDGHYVFGVKNKYLSAAVLVLKEAMNDKYDYIDWWLFEPASDRTIWSADESESWDLKTPEALYDYILNECK